MNVFTGLMDTSRTVAAPTGPAGPTRPRDRGHGGRAALETTAWCALVLVLANLAVGLVLVIASPVVPGADVRGLSLAVLALLAVVPVLVIGWPAAVLTEWLLRHEPRESRHVAVFALVGAGAAVLLGLVGRTLAPDAGLLVLLATEGALVAGGGRLLTGWSRRTRAARRAEQVQPRATAVAA